MRVWITMGVRMYLDERALQLDRREISEGYASRG